MKHVSRNSREYRNWIKLLSINKMMMVCELLNLGRFTSASTHTYTKRGRYWPVPLTFNAFNIEGNTNFSEIYLKVYEQAMTKENSRTAWVRCESQTGKVYSVNVDTIRIFRVRSSHFIPKRSEIVRILMRYTLRCIL